MTQWDDGPVGVSQCPIIPGGAFLYQFSIPSQAGSFWYHSHHGAHKLCPLPWVRVQQIHQGINIVMGYEAPS